MNFIIEDQNYKRIKTMFNPFIHLYPDINNNIKDKKNS